MNTIENLNERVEKAIRKFHKSEDQRRNENKSLSGILNDLEIKFVARTAELGDCNERIKELESSNVSLNALVCQLVEIVEKTADEASDDPVFRASSAASEIVERFVAASPANDLAVSRPTVEVSGPPAFAPDLDERPASFADGRFEDIEDEFRLAEDLFEKTEGASEFPKLVYDAMALARGDEAALSADPVATEAPSHSGDLDIKEIMARLEMAAERAQLRADEDARRDQASPQENKRARTA